MKAIRWEPPEADGWIGVDLDGTLAFAGGWKPGDPEHTIGVPIPLMVKRVKRWLKHGRVINGRRYRDIRIFTARATRPSPLVLPAIKEWCIANLGRELPITATKDYGMIEFWDDRGVRVEVNTGRRIR